jgi:leader peptidase (prepilin peptidase)/N-methyltransferase
MYPLVELTTGVLFFAAYQKFGLSTELALAFCLVFVALSAGFTDLFTALDEDFECGIIPDSIIVFGLLSGAITTYLISGDITFSLKGAAVGFLGLFIPSYLYKLVRKREGMGGGDIKLVAVFGAFLGMKSIYFIIFGSALAGAVVGIFWQLLSGKKDIMLPFGPFISMAALIYLFFETPLNRLLFGI